MMLHHQQFLTNIVTDNRPQQQSSPSDNSMSTATPPQVSRASPASTALVMSNNNIALSNLPSSRQLTPSNGSANSNGTDSSNGSGRNACLPPNPMARQFACHAKSMSAGIVVPVPGISNNLATATGVNQNNIINQTIVANQQQQQHQQQQMIHNHQRQVSNQSGNSNNNNHRANTLHHQQIAINENNKQHNVKEHKSHHHRSVSSQQYQQRNLNQQQHHQQQQQQQQQSSHHHQDAYPFRHHQDGSSQNFIDARTGSSIVLSSNDINNLHHRSASTQLSNINLGAGHPQAAQRTHDPSNYLSHVTNSIWSIDENISKSHSKLTASGYLAHPYFINPSITDVSCDNLSNAGGPAPGYYLHHASNLMTNGGVGVNNMGGTLQTGESRVGGHSLSASGNTLTKQPEFLPICDLMFNLISMIIYFCENVFGIIALIALYYHASNKYWALIGAAFMFGSNLLCQYLSLRWLCKMKLEESRRKCEAQKELEDEEECERRQYYNRMDGNMRNYNCGSSTWLPDGASEVQLKFLLSIALDAILHIFCLGFLVRYIKLVIPVSDVSQVKKEARDLCMLRMIHGFVQSAPLLLLQSYMVCSQNYSTPVVNLSITSVILSLVNVCWALASFTKYARKKYMHKFVLTWFGILSQLLWRLGTISSRVAALTIYAVYYNYWMLVVLFLHWLTMFMWLMKVGNLLRDEVNMSRSRRLSMAAGAAWIYCFCYMNFEEVSLSKVF